MKKVFLLSFLLGSVLTATNPVFAQGEAGTATPAAPAATTPADSSAATPSVDQQVPATTMPDPAAPAGLPAGDTSGAITTPAVEGGTPAEKKEESKDGEKKKVSAKKGKKGKARKHKAKGSKTFKGCTIVVNKASDTFAQKADAQTKCCTPAPACSVPAATVEAPAPEACAAA
ncbi:MAG: hypothetical protein BGO07_00030 [Alphaproteobacteria bacterium 40-19]|nr:MAG: hypothetical protein BGO07_00030 [Alphaproteobacteria bacterium 40-19]